MLLNTECRWYQSQETSAWKQASLATLSNELVIVSKAHADMHLEVPPVKNQKPKAGLDNGDRLTWQNLFQSTESLGKDYPLQNATLDGNN